MSSRKIRAALERKGYEVKFIEYVRNDPTPSGYARGYDLEVEWSEAIEDTVFDTNPDLEFSQFMQFDDAASALEWASELPDIRGQRQ